MNEVFTLEDVGILQEGDVLTLAEKIMFVAMTYGYTDFYLNDDVERDVEEIRKEVIELIDNCIEFLNSEATDDSVKFIRTESTIEIVAI